MPFEATLSATFSCDDIKECVKQAVKVKRDLSIYDLKGEQFVIVDCVTDAHLSCQEQGIYDWMALKLH